MTISETYEKFKHFDRLLSDREWLPQSIHGVLLHEFWMAIRDAAQPNTAQAPQCGPACGEMPDCAVCGRRKQPRGRSAPMEMAGTLCHSECRGYDLPPLPGHLWPGEGDNTAPRG